MPDFGYRLSLIEHDIWSEMDLQGQGTPLDPLKAVLFTHTESEECNEDCPEVLRKLQVFKVYGWEYESNFLKDLSGNSSLVIAFVGNFSRNPPKDCQLKAAQALILESVKRKKLQPEYKLFVLANNAEALQRELMHWPRYTSPRRMK
ncbi:peptidoglycan-recognition protein LD isoform X2 [Drosophila rhopaloa]|uniref:Peptidoglycan recognition protein family domain-containing protein n=1 Tax=Drosophila rhopaloa TaxID=1041015 RepID=A0ABM5J4U4_DRORH|nr:peptidoglycan-recognition protein LD isoform X2 [Drosophila rhopaloa]